MWLDVDADGVFDNVAANCIAPDVALKGVTVTVKDANGEELGTTTTDDQGTYRLADPGIGEVPIQPDNQYKICFDPTTAADLLEPLKPARLNPPLADATDDDRDSDIDADGCIFVTTPADGENLTVAAGFLPPPTMFMRGRGYVDVDNSGTPGAGDTISYAYEVTNRGDLPVSQITAHLYTNRIVCPDSELAPGKPLTRAKTYTLTPADEPVPGVTYYAVATGVDSSGAAVQDIDSSGVVWANVPMPRPIGSPTPGLSGSPTPGPASPSASPGHSTPAEFPRLMINGAATAADR